MLLWTFGSNQQFRLLLLKWRKFQNYLHWNHTTFFPFRCSSSFVFASVPTNQNRSQPLACANEVQLKISKHMKVGVVASCSGVHPKEGVIAGCRWLGVALSRGGGHCRSWVAEGGLSPTWGGVVDVDGLLSTSMQMGCVRKTYGSMGKTDEGEAWMGCMREEEGSF